MIQYEVFINTIWGSDVLKFDDRDSALKAAVDWSKKEKDQEVVVLRVTTVEDVSVTNGVVSSLHHPSHSSQNDLISWLL